MSEQAPDRVWSGIDIPKTVAGALAAVCAAVIGSFLGVAGTLIGAAVASVMTSVGTEVYHRSLNRGARRFQSLVTAPAAVGTPPVAAAERRDPSPRPGIRWRRAAYAAGALFVLAMGAITAVELTAGRPVSSMVTNDKATGSTLGGVTEHDESRQPGTPVPAVTPTVEPAAPDGEVPDGETPIEAPATSPSPAEPGTSSAPAVEQSAAPADGPD